MILKKLIVGPLGTNCYLFGSSKTNEIVIIDPGAEPKTIIEEIDKMGSKPTAILLTHGHFDHSQRVGKIKRHYDVPLMFNKKEYDSGVFNRKEADKWLEEGDEIEVGELTLHILETPGHSPGSLSFYSKDIKQMDGRNIDGILFTGDLLFRRSIGRSDVPGGNQEELFSSIKKKIMYNSDLSDDFLVFPGHMGNSSIGDERQRNMFKRYFL